MVLTDAGPGSGPGSGFFLMFFSGIVSCCKLLLQMYAFHKEFAMFCSKCLLFLRFYKGLGPSAVGSQIPVVLSSPELFVCFY